MSTRISYYSRYFLQTEHFHWNHNFCDIHTSFEYCGRKIIQKVILFTTDRQSVPSSASFNFAVQCTKTNKARRDYCHILYKHFITWPLLTVINFTLELSCLYRNKTFDAFLLCIFYFSLSVFYPFLWVFMYIFPTMY